MSVTVIAARLTQIRKSATPLRITSNRRFCNRASSPVQSYTINNILQFQPDIMSALCVFANRITTLIQS